MPKMEPYDKYVLNPKAKRDKILVYSYKKPNNKLISRKEIEDLVDKTSKEMDEKNYTGQIAVNILFDDGLGWKQSKWYDAGQDIELYTHNAYNEHYVDFKKYKIFQIMFKGG